MKMDAQKFISDVEDEKFATNSAEMTLEDIKKDVKAAIKPQLSFMEEMINSGRLASTLLQVKGQEVSFYLQNNIINLPYRYVKNISKIMSGSGEDDLHVYMFVESPDVNRSKMRIDELAAQDDFAVSDEIIDKLAAWVLRQIGAIENTREEQAEADKQTDKKKKTTKKKSTKKTTKKK